MISPTLATIDPHVELWKLAVESPMSFIIKYLSPVAGVPGSNVAGFIIFLTVGPTGAGELSGTVS